MRKENISFEQITNELTNVFAQPERLAQYQKNGLQYVGLCGWAGPMLPLTREAYIATFGEMVTTAAENEARRRVAAWVNGYEATNHARHEKEADQNEQTRPAPAPGLFVWAVYNGLKNEGQGLRGLIEEMTQYPDYSRRSLVCIEKVLHVDDLNDDAMPDRLVNEAATRGEAFPGGARNEDDNYTDLLDEYRCYYTLAAAVVDAAGRWFLIDAEGYDYARYLLLPTDWPAMFAPELATATAKIEARKEAERMEQERKEAEELAEYRARCDRWAKYMIDLRPLQAAADEAYKLHGWRSKEYKDAERKLANTRRANISAMVREAFPGLKFSIRKNNGWGSAYDLRYIDGPTLEEFEAATDFNLFAHGHDTFDGMTDCAGYEREKHTDFADRYMGNVSGDIDVRRDYDPAKLDEMAAEICEVTGKDAEAKGYDWGELRKVADHFGVDADGLWRHVDKDWNTARDVAFRVWNELGLYTRPEKTAKATEKANTGNFEDATGDSPAEGLQLVEIANGVAVEGDPRTTYKNRKEIKAHGATWNREAKRWEATGEDAETLRAWFA